MEPDLDSRKLCISFHESTQSTEISSSQNLYSYKDTLSQPAPGLSKREKLLWLQKRRGTGLWVSCDNCNKWRYLAHILDKHELPKKWFCELNPDRSAANCSVPEEPLNPRDEEDLIHSEYSAGSVVWARLHGWPWWPAMVDDCVDIEQFYWLDGFSDIPTSYNVVFFDSKEVTRAWIPRGHLKPYTINKNVLKDVPKKYKKRLDVAMKLADDADMLPVANRLLQYSFITRYKGTIGDSPKLDKKIKRKFKNKINKQYNIYVSASESDSDSDTNSQFSRNSKTPEVHDKKNKNVILVGTHIDNKNISSNAELEIEKEVIANTEIPVDFFKQSNATTNGPHNGSILPIDTLEIDNDSSKTYLPRNEALPQSTDELEFQSDCQDLQVRVVTTPSSGDFDF